MDETPHQPKAADRTVIILRVVLGVILGALVIAGAWFGYAYKVSPAAIRNPVGTHYHFRLQIINGGTPINFADDKFQTPLNTDICTQALTAQPIHFHDKLDQFTHIHWAHMTGGLLLKNYGWNLIGGPDSILGYRFDKFPKLASVPIHGRSLPNPPAGAKYYIYTGDDMSYKQRNWNDFLKQDLRDFFAGNKATGGILNSIIPVAYAHDDSKLTALNDVLGSVVIFVQKDQPTDQQIKDRFNHLVPLPESTCGG